MASTSIRTKKRMVYFSIILLVLLTIIVVRVGYLQVVRGESLKKEALAQWTKGVPIEATRGTIYDSTGKKLAVSVKRSTVWARPKDISAEDFQETVDIVSETLGMDKAEVTKLLKSDQPTLKVKQWIEQDVAEKLEKEYLPGIDVVEDSKRYYPKSSFASYVIGHTSDDQVGQYGIESVMENELSGIEGKLVTVTDGQGSQLPDTQVRKYPGKDGNNVYLTLDNRIQEIAEEALEKGVEEAKAKSGAAIVMDPKTGDILAMATTPGYDLNDPRGITDEAVKEKWDKMTDQEKQDEWFKNWRNFNVNDSYEPGSTFKPLVIAAALEENVIDEDYTFTCDGYLTEIKSDTPIKCWKYYDPHGLQTLSEGLQHSCNDMMGDIALKMGGDMLYDYIKLFGFGELTGVDLPGEAPGIIPASGADIKNATLANVSFGQGISVTPIQLITAISTVANGGDLMQPQIVKEVKTSEGKVVSEREPVVKRKVLSSKVADEVLKMLGDTAQEEYKSILSIPGYDVGAKTGTSQKIVDGAYSNEKYIGSFVGVAPLDDPQFVVLTIVDEPSGDQYYGSQVAAPIGEDIINETLKYLKVKPTKDMNEAENMVEVPNVTGKTIKEASEILKEAGLDYQTDAYYVTPEDKVKSQEPSAGQSVALRSFVQLFVPQEYDVSEVRVPTEEEIAAAKARAEAAEKKEAEKKEAAEKKEQDSSEKTKLPSLTGKTLDEAKKILDAMGVKYQTEGTGKVVSQQPAANTEITKDTVIKIKLQ